jgi:hypothetical protein
VLVKGIARAHKGIFWSRDDLMQNVDELEAIYADVPGGLELLAWFGHVPSFHDAEIVSLTLFGERQAFYAFMAGLWLRTVRVF